MSVSVSTSARRGGIRHRLSLALYRDWQLWVLLLPCLVFFVVFHYFPMYGVQIAFRNYKDAFGKYHELSTGNTVTIDPVQAASFTNGAEGKISFYLDAGTYKIKETVWPANTEPQGGDELTRTVRAGNTEPVTAVFDNKEKLGEILIHKKDDTNNHLPIQGAVFGLYEDRAHSKPVKDESGQDYTVTTDSVGDASFTRIVPGNYYLYEISVPSDFVKSEDVTPVTVTAGAASGAWRP